MSYVNADEVLPEDLIREIQKYVDGKVLYIPRRSEKAMGWGEKNGAKNRLAKRNKEIVSRFNSGETIAELGKMFFLSEKRKKSKNLHSLPVFLLKSYKRKGL